MYLDQLITFCDMRQKQFVIRPFPSPPAALERMRTFLKLRSTHSSRTGSLKTREKKNSAAQKRLRRRPARQRPQKTHLGPDDEWRKMHARIGLCASGAHAAAGRNIFSGETHIHT